MTTAVRDKFINTINRLPKDYLDQLFNTYEFYDVHDEIDDPYLYNETIRKEIFKEMRLYTTPNDDIKISLNPPMKRDKLINDWADNKIFMDDVKRYFKVLSNNKRKTIDRDMIKIFIRNYYERIKRENNSFIANYNKCIEEITQK
jgi:hypothetical protein